jgi:hypothetical protein
MQTADSALGQLEIIDIKYGRGDLRQCALVPISFVKYAQKHSVIMISGFISEDSSVTWSSLRDVIASQGMGVFDFEWESITYEQLSNGVKD